MKSTIFTLLLLISIFFNSLGQAGLVASYPFNGNANDESGNGNHGTINGATLTTNRFGTPNSAYIFNGYNNYISIPPTNIATPEYTYSAWVNTDNLTNYVQSIVSVGNSGADQTLGFYNPNGNPNGQYWYYFSYLYFESLPIPQIQVSAINIINSWHNVVATRTLTELKLYVDGQVISSVSSGGVSPLYASPISAAIGARSRKDIQFFSGKIDDVSLFNRALTTNEVETLYANGLIQNNYSDTNQASLILQVNNSVNDFIFNVATSPSETKEVFTIKGNGNVGVGNSFPKSKVDINGTFGTKLKTITENGNTILDETATVWNFRNRSGSITLPNAANFPNRRYYLVNRGGDLKSFTNNYVDFAGGFNNYLLPNSSLELISDGENWLQIK